MQKISSGIDSFDRLIDFFYIGDHVVWEIDAGAPYNVFLQNFIRQSFDDSQKIIYISFNRSPQSILKSVKDFLNPEHFVLVDCSTSGKGKNDKTFARFYETPSDINMVKIDDPKSIEQFTQSLNAIEDSLTGMQDLWSDEKGKEFIYVLKGQVSLIVDGVEESVGEGDSVFLKDEIPSSWKNEKKESAELLVIHM